LQQPLLHQTTQKFKRKRLAYSNYTYFYLTANHRLNPTFTEPTVQHAILAQRNSIPSSPKPQLHGEHVSRPSSSLSPVYATGSCCKNSTSIPILTRELSSVYRILSSFEAPLLPAFEAQHRGGVVQLSTQLTTMLKRHMCREADSTFLCFA
jgi:hypothetical protein